MARFIVVVNNRPIVNITDPLGAEAVRVLRDVPGIVVQALPGGHVADVVVRAGDVTAVVELAGSPLLGRSLRRQ
jgi:hypothetical protein